MSCLVGAVCVVLVASLNARAAVADRLSKIFQSDDGDVSIDAMKKDYEVRGAALLCAGVGACWVSTENAVER